MRFAWAALFYLAGCAEVGAVHCADGTVCPAGTQCGDPIGCISPGDCGDGVISGDERCDDGNTGGGDGCAANCRSLELCGNAIRDDAAGEECDDGNLASHDGCSSGCLVETARWEQLPATGPPERLYAAIAWDPDRGRAVMTGGQSAGGLPVRRSDTWYLSRRTWLQGPELPTPLTVHAMASDNRGAILVFGGESESGECGASSNCRACSLLDDTAWTACPSTLAAGRVFHSMTTAPDGGIVLFGGIPGADGPWEWRAGAWTAAAANAPGARFNVAAAFDPVANRSVMMGGGGTVALDTLTWDGASWAHTTNALTRLAGAAVYDPARRRMLAFGGQVSNSGGISPPNLLDWTGDGDWHEVPVVVGPGGRFGHVMVHDPIEHASVVFGGQIAATNAVASDTWLLRWESATPDERCDGSDADADGQIGCADEDCWARCTPCAPGATCDPSDPKCGDGVCNPYLEDAALCPEDC